MQQWRYLVVDDEPIARDILLQYGSHLPFLAAAGSCGSALEARQVLQDQKVDILFLDINMPVLDGLSFLRTMKNPPQVIFTTAYKEFAVDAFDLAACDYLLKPFSLERFMVAADRAIALLQGSQPAVVQPSPPLPEEVFIRADGKIYKLDPSALLFIEANGNYTRFVLQQQVLLPAMTFQAASALLSPHLFLRVHRSFVVNRSRIDRIEGNRVFVGGREIPIGSNFREAFLQALGLS
ncbi:MAG: LytTR family DNA-binding domain-containing protein [Flavihumibacter sp.]